MVISDFAIKRPMITVVTMVALVVFGLFALWRLQTDEFPDIQQPVVLTFIPYPGASPEGVEREVLKPVEDAIKGISGVDQIFGTAGDGYAQIITLFIHRPFAFGKSLDLVFVQFSIYTAQRQFFLGLQ